jgi:hypothetical protein
MPQVTTSRPAILAATDDDSPESRAVCSLLACVLIDAGQLHAATSYGCPECNRIGDCLCDDHFPHYEIGLRYFHVEQRLTGWGTGPHGPLNGDDWQVITEALADAMTYRSGRSDLQSRALLAAYRELARQ